MLFFVDGRFAAWMAVALVLIVTPGPDTVLILRNTLRDGARSASFTAVGVGVGSAAWAAASVIGVAALLESSDAAFTVLKLAGAAYLVYLGLRTLAGTFRPSPAAAADSAPATPGPATQSAGSAFLQGVLNNLLNPKAGAIFATVMPQFIQPGDSAVRLILMVVCYDAIVIAWLCAYALVVSRVRRTTAGARVRKGLERVAGTVMIGLGVRLALEARAA
ncbi:MAG TPA: LysE family translocator [Candidatus Acidoferrum sp.]|jgi:threonine/homoserine/homoserine lactone efflux protein|nr:LysE family translocator [Candidatus Acidoferrum sp.]